MMSDSNGLQEAAILLEDSKIILNWRVSVCQLIG